MEGTGIEYVSIIVLKAGQQATQCDTYTWASGTSHNGATLPRTCRTHMYHRVNHLHPSANMRLIGDAQLARPEL